MVQGSTVCVFVLGDQKSPTASIFSNGFYRPKYMTFVQLFILRRPHRHHLLITENLSVLQSLNAYMSNHSVVIDVVLCFATPKGREINFFLNNHPDALINQIYSVIKLYMFRASSLPIIRSFLLYIRHW